MGNVVPEANPNGSQRNIAGIVNEAGNVQVTPAGPGSLPIDLKELVDDLRSRGLSLPLLIRFSDILRTRIEHLVRFLEPRRIADAVLPPLGMLVEQAAEALDAVASRAAVKALIDPSR